MKAFWGSLLLFAALLSFVLFNARYVHESTAYLQEATDAMRVPSQRNERLDELETFWKSNRKWAALSMTRDDLDRIDELITSLRWAQDTQNEESFAYYRDLLEAVVEEFNLNERLSFESIL